MDRALHVRHPPGVHGANLDYIRSLKAAGYRVSDTHRLVKLRDHGVSARYARAVRETNGRLLSVDDLIRRRDRGDR